MKYLLCLVLCQVLNVCIDIWSNTSERTVLADILEKSFDNKKQVSSPRKKNLEKIIREIFNN